jgi:integrase/recombinase XerD
LAQFIAVRANGCRPLRAAVDVVGAGNEGPQRLDIHPIDIDIPLHPALQASIEAAKIGNLTFLITEFGKPFTANGFGGKFKDWCRQANLPHCSAHGVRKATATELAESGATPHEIGAITGHTSLKEIERYTKAARKRGLANNGMAKLTGS